MLDGVDSPGEYAGSLLDIGRIWEGSSCVAANFGTDCGTSGAVGGPTSTYARVAYRDDALYFYIRVRDDYQTYAVTPAECVAHWLADSVEILIDPRGNASDNAMDTANTFKLGIFPFTNDPTNSNGNGVNGPCWSRDADNHQGFSTGPLAATVDDAPNAPGVQVYSSAQWVGSNDTTVDHAYAGGGYTLEVKIPASILPAAIDPAKMGLNITPYDNDDNTAGTGSTVLRHIDQSARLAWSTFGSRPVRSVPLGPRDAAGLHAAGRPADDPAHAERLAPEPRRRRLTADDRPVGPQRRADLRSRARSGGARAHRRRSEPDHGRAQGRHHGGGGRHRARVPVRRQPAGREQELHAGLEHEL